MKKIYARLDEKLLDAGFSSYEALSLRKEAILKIQNLWYCLNHSSNKNHYKARIKGVLNEYKEYYNNLEYLQDCKNSEKELYNYWYNSRI